MAKVYNVNSTPATGAVAIYTLKETLKSAGWTVPSSSDGTTYNSSGDQISSGGSGAGGLANNSAWFRIQDPGTRRELTFQRGTSNVEWRIKYSALAKFSGGSPDATQTPTATDGQIMCGGGTDASPTYYTLFGTDGSFRWNVICESDPIGNVYGLWAFSAEIPGGAHKSMILVDPMAVSSYNSNEPDPVVLYMKYSASGNVAVATTSALQAAVGSNGVRAWRAFGTGSAAFSDNVRALTYDLGVGSPIPTGSLAANPFDSKYVAVAVGFAIDGTTDYFKGFSAKLYWATNSSLVFPNTANLSTNAYVFVDKLMIPWPEGISPAL